MTVWIAILRGINVGGHNTVPMKDLRKLLEDAGFESVQTYIQSGNCVFGSPNSKGRIAKTIRHEMKQKFGFEVPVIVLSRKDMQTALTQNPFAKQSSSHPKSVHLFFLTSIAADADMASLSTLASPNESFRLTDAVFYLSAPDGIGRSKLAASVEKALRVPVTARNFRTAAKLLELADQYR